jgi:hypothetical protein
MKKTLFSVAILAMMFLASCTKPGPIGPAGTAGTNGKDGTAGTNGTNGTNGINGNANVIGTSTVALNSNSWTALGTYFGVALSVPAITQAIVDKGVVLVYEQDATYWRALPYTSGIISKFFVFTLNSVEIYYQNTDGSQTTNPGNKTYRIVAISASVAMANPNVNWENYEEVKTILNLK